MVVVPEPEAKTRSSVIRYTSKGTVAMHGDGQNDYICGSCSSPILEGMNPGQVVGVAFTCNKCGALNDMPG